MPWPNSGPEAPASMTSAELSSTWPGSWRVGASCSRQSCSERPRGLFDIANDFGIRHRTEAQKDEYDPPLSRLSVLVVPRHHRADRSAPRAIRARAAVRYFHASAVPRQAAAPPSPRPVPAGRPGCGPQVGTTRVSHRVSPREAVYQDVLHGLVRSQKRWSATCSALSGRVESDS